MKNSTAKRSWESVYTKPEPDYKFFDALPNNWKLPELRALGFLLCVHSNVLQITIDPAYMLNPIEGIEKWYIYIEAEKQYISVIERRLGKNTRSHIAKFYNDEHAMSKALAIAIKTGYSRQKDLIKKGNKYIITLAERHELRGKLKSRKFGF